jgi:hypothetical protein
MQYLAKKPFLVIFILTVIFIFFLNHIIGHESSFLRSGIASGLAIILAPRKKKIQTQSGRKTQITWVFLKEPIFLD